MDFSDSEEPCLNDARNNVEKKRSRLHLAVIEQQTEIVSNLIISKDALNLDAKDFYKKTALDYAVQSRNLQIIKLLLVAGAKIFKSSVLKAVESLNIDILALFLDKIAAARSANTDSDLSIQLGPIEKKEEKDEDLNYVVTAKPERSRVKRIKKRMHYLLFDEDEDDREKKDLHLYRDLLGLDEDLKNEDCSVRTLFELVVRFGNSNIIKPLLSYKAWVELEEIFKEKLLHEAIKTKNINMVKVLLDSGINVEAVNKFGNTPMLLSLDPKNLDILQLLLDYKANVNAKNNADLTPLHLAIKLSKGNSDYTNVIKLLLEAKADVKSVCKNGDYPLSSAVEFQNENILKLLLDAGVNLDTMDKLGNTPLHTAVELQNENIVKLLLAAGADVNAENKKGNIPLHLSVRLYGNRIFQLLVDLGSNIDAQDSEKNTPLQVAIKSSNGYAPKILLEAGADVNIADNRGYTPLHTAAGYLKLDLVKLLSEYGANLNSWSDDHKTPFMLFVKNAMGMVKKDLIDGFNCFLEYFNVNLVNETGKNILGDILESDDYAKKRIFFYKLIVEYVAKLKVLNQEVDPSLIDIIFRYRDYSEHFSKCIQELENAKSTKIHNCRISFLNLLVDDKFKFIKYAGNRDLVKNLKGCVKKFPTFGSTMRSNMTYGIESRRIFDEAADVLSFHLPILNPTHLIIRNTLDTLSVQDWNKLCEKKRPRE